MASAARTVRRGRALLPLPRRRWHHPDPLNPSTKGWRSAVKEGELPTKGWEAEIARGLELGLPAASSIVDRDIPTFSRGELPHFAGINTFMKAPYLEDVRLVGNYDATVMGVPYDGGTTYRSGTRFGPQGIRRISALYSPYNYELGVDLREQMTLCARAAQFAAQFSSAIRRNSPTAHAAHPPAPHRCDAGDVFTIPANIEKTFDQISNAVAHVAASGSFPVILGGDHSIGFPTVRGLASVTSKRIGMRWGAPRTPRAADAPPQPSHPALLPRQGSFTSTGTPTSRRPTSTSGCTRRRTFTPPRSQTFGPRTSYRSASAAGRRAARRGARSSHASRARCSPPLFRAPSQVPRAAVPIMRDRRTNIFSVADVEDLGPDKVIERGRFECRGACRASPISRPAFPILSIHR